MNDNEFYHGYCDKSSGKMVHAAKYTKPPAVKDNKTALLLSSGFVLLLLPDDDDDDNWAGKYNPTSVPAKAASAVVNWARMAWCLENPEASKME